MDSLSISIKLLKCVFNVMSTLAQTCYLNLRSCIETTQTNPTHIDKGMVHKDNNGIPLVSIIPPT